MNTIDHIQCRGYIEGYYGRLLSWGDRHSLVNKLSQLGMSSYFYAPKEDIFHRFHWREAYPGKWRKAFSYWAEQAEAKSVNIIAGLAPGLDFDFNHINTGPDFKALESKARQLLDDGANAIALLMDDINTVFNEAQNGFSSEGEAHAQLANTLADAIGYKVFTVPRVYAAELEHESPGYAAAYSQYLHSGHAIFHCGSHIVAAAVHDQDYSEYTDNGRHRMVVWDNLYANDYCPRRLYLGPWVGRETQVNVMLNPTGLPATDLLLLDIMGKTSRLSADIAWSAALREHAVPESFNLIENYFRHPPVVPVTNPPGAAEFSLDQQLAAIDSLLWKWKTPLSREWYPYLFGLKHDLSLRAGVLTESRVRKTQLEPLASLLLREP